MKKCAKCKTEERYTKSHSYCRECKNKVDNKSYHKNKVKRKAYSDKYKLDNPDFVKRQRETTKKWLKDNPNYQKEWTVNKYATDVKFQLKMIIYAQMHQALKSKNNTTLSYLGCDLDTFKKHLESQFDSKMTWENRGQYGWHIDHIKPVNTFDLTEEDRILECWHYTNLRPLWWKDNLTRPKDGTDIK